MLKRYSLFVFLAVSVCSPAIALGHDVVCRAPGIEGQDISYKHAKGIIGNYTTSDKTEIKVYVEKVDGGYYYHSNFCTLNCVENYPTKIFSGKPIPLKQALENIIYTPDSHPSADEWDEEANNLLNSSANISLDKSLFDAKTGRPLIDVSGAQHLEVVSGEDKVTLVGSVTSLDTEIPPPLLLKNISGCCLDGFPPLAAAKILVGLKKASINKSEIRFASLVRDSATAQAIQASQTLKGMSIPASKLESLDALKDAIQSSRDQTLILLGHVENGSFVTRNSANKIIMQADFETIHQFAVANNVTLIHFGCNTAKQISEDTLDVGVAVKFNTVELVNRLGEALKKSDNFADLLNSVSEEGLRIVVSEHFVDKLDVNAFKADVYAQPKDDTIWIKIAQFFYFGRRS